MNFINGAQLLEYCEKENKKISEAMFERETTFLEQDGEKTRARMKKAFSIMQAAVKKPLKEDIVSMGGMIGGESKKLHALREQGKNICGDVVSKAIAYAVGVLEVNASMGLIVAAPTAGSSGVIPGTLCALQEQYGFTDDEICQALFNAAAIGYLITRNATTAGAEGGCQAEVGSASAMAASAAVELLGGTPRQCMDAASFAMVNILGLVCDPIERPGGESLPEPERHGRFQCADLCGAFPGGRKEHHAHRRDHWGHVRRGTFHPIGAQGDLSGRYG